MTSDLSTPACESLKKSRWPVEGSGGVGWGGGGGGLIWEFGNSSAHLHIKRPGHEIQEQLLTIPFQFNCQLQWGAEYAPNGDTEG